MSRALVSTGSGNSIVQVVDLGTIGDSNTRFVNATSQRVEILVSIASPNTYIRILNAAVGTVVRIRAYAGFATASLYLYVDGTSIAYNPPIMVGYKFNEFSVTKTGSNTWKRGVASADEQVSYAYQSKRPVDIKGELMPVIYPSTTIMGSDVGAEGEMVTIYHNESTYMFEFDTDANYSSMNTPISPGTSLYDSVSSLASAISNIGLNAVVTTYGDGVVISTYSLGDTLSSSVQGGSFYNSASSSGDAGTSSVALSFGAMRPVEEFYLHDVYIQNNGTFGTVYVYKGSTFITSIPMPTPGSPEYLSKLVGVQAFKDLFEVGWYYADNSMTFSTSSGASEGAATFLLRGSITDEPTF